MVKILFFGGKGGVGKTSCSSAYAIAKARQNQKVLLISTDPAHSTSDLFNMTIGSEVVKIRDNLYGLEIDPQKESDAYINGIKDNMHRIISPIVLDEMNKQLDAARISPGSHESALFDKMMAIIIESTDLYDLIIFDTAPTGHTIRLLSLPEMLGAWMDTLLRKRRKTVALKRMINNVTGKTEEKDPIVEILTKRKDNLEKARHILMDDDTMQFVFVMNPERLPIEETKKAVKLLKHYRIPVGKLVVNRILPDNSLDTFWKQKKEQEKQYLLEIENDFKVKELYKIPMFQEDMHNKSIELMAEYFV